MASQLWRLHMQLSLMVLGNIEQDGISMHVTVLSHTQQLIIGAQLR